MKFDFLISSERSGSNLITKLIDNHSEYCGPSPTHLFRIFTANIHKYGDLNNNDNWISLVKDIYDVFNYKIGIWNADISLQELIDLKKRSLANVLSYIYKKEADKNCKNNLFIKEVSTYNFHDFILNHFPKSKYIWLVRDPRDMALSWVNSPVHRGDIVRASYKWQNDQKQTMQIYNTLNKNKIHLVNYENLIDDQSDSLKSICDFFEIDFESSMLEYNKNDTTNSNASLTDNWKNLNKNIIKGNYKKYKNKLSIDQIRLIEYVCKKEMLFLNYELDFPILSDSEFKKLYNKLFKRERYNKPEYELISYTEKEKREEWHQKFLEIQNK